MMSPDATKDNMGKPKRSADKSGSRDSVDEKPVKGVFKTKTITIRRLKDPHTFKCSVCSFLTPVSLHKHRYSHIEESEQFQCRTCDKHFPFESQLKSHRHMHRRTRYYSCASANCE